MQSLDSLETDESKLKEIGEFTFNSTEGITSDFLLLIEDKMLKLKHTQCPLQENLPYESFNCYSQYNENIYLLMVSKNKFWLLKNR